LQQFYRRYSMKSLPTRHLTGKQKIAKSGWHRLFPLLRLLPFLLSSELLCLSFLRFWNCCACPFYAPFCPFYAPFLFTLLSFLRSLRSVPVLFTLPFYAPSFFRGLRALNLPTPVTGSLKTAENGSLSDAGHTSLLTYLKPLLK
jgi:hypothetical protein